MIKILILTNQELIGEALRLVLSAHKELNVDLKTTNCQGATDKYDIVMLDMNLSETDCAGYKETLKRTDKLIMLQLTGSSCTLYNFSAAGCWGYLLQSRKVSLDELYQEIVKVYHGLIDQNKSLSNKAFNLFSRVVINKPAMPMETTGVESLSESEWQIVQNIKLGLSNKEIATKLSLSEGTIRNYLSNVLAKLNLRDRTQLAIWALQIGDYQQNLMKNNA